MRKISFLFVALFCALILPAQSAFIPEPTLKMVSDFEELLTNEEEEQLAYDIKKQYDANSNQLMVVTLPTSYLGDLTIEDYAQKLFDKWQPGQKDLNNGVILIICGSHIDSIGRKLRIHTGYGLEGALPDLLCLKIEQDIIIPELKTRNYFKAIKNGSISILSIINQENAGKAPNHKIDIQKNDDRVYDYALVFTDEQKQQLENEMKGLFNFSFIINTTLNYNSPENGIYLTQKLPSDTVLMEIDYNPGYYLSAMDSTLRFDASHKTYYIKYNALEAEFDFNDYNHLYEQRDEIAAAIDKEGIFNITMGLVKKAKAVHAGKLHTAILIVGSMVAVSGLIYLLFLFTRPAKQKKKQQKKMGVGKVLLGIVLVLFAIATGLILFSFELPFFLFFASYLNIPTWMNVTLSIAMAVLQIFNLVLISKINSNYFSSKLFAWAKSSGSGSGYSYSSSSSSYSSSSSSYSSSSSSYSSSSSTSNSGYYGGGGRSGGGGASSSW